MKTVDKIKIGDIEFEKPKAPTFEDVLKKVDPCGILEPTDIEYTQLKAVCDFNEKFCNDAYDNLFNVIDEINKND